MEKVHLGNLEQELWKKNVKEGPRHKKEFLDVSNEDFTKNTSLSIEGREITPSSKLYSIIKLLDFNIFRDSLR
jgi:hypothetical protein